MRARFVWCLLLLAALSATGWCASPPTSVRVAITPGNSGLPAVSAVDIEDYVAGLLPSQVFDAAPLEAMKAQAVALRTWVMRDLGLQASSTEYKHHRQDGFGYCADPACCRTYEPHEAARAQVALAVRETRGQVLTYRGSPILASFDASAGGETESIDSAWPGNPPRDYPYLCTVDSASDQSGAKAADGYSDCWRWSGVKVKASDIEGRLQEKFKDGVGEPTKLIVRS